MINAWAFVGIKGANVEEARRILGRAPRGALSYSDATGSYYSDIRKDAVCLIYLAQAVSDYEAIKAAENKFLKGLKK